jgi:DNA-directed RNA polymerase specialized sigma24 family protein
MSTQAAIAQELPKLRRYARALTGSQSSGDGYVASTLEALIEEPALIEQSSSVRVALYKAFTAIWNSVKLNQSVEPAAAAGADRHVMQITPRPRQAFLLLTLEDFSEEEAAEILSVSVPEVRRLADESGREMAAEIATDVLIIEDEPMIAMDLEELVEKLGHKVIGNARTHAEAISLAMAHRPGMILADIRLADMSSGLDAVNELLKSFSVPVIFITAFPEQFLTGERPEPTFLIPKPYQPATVSAVISQALFFEQNASNPGGAPKREQAPKAART